MDTATDWGPIGEPLHPGAAGPDDPIYRENAFLTFAALTGEHETDPVYGEVHVSTSPNSDGGRRARFTLVRRGRVTEVVEPLDAGSFRSDSIDFDPAGPATVKTGRINAELTYTPRFVPGNYTENAVLGTVQESTLNHYQQGVDVHGRFEIDGESFEITSPGFRDRTWGYRDEPKQWIDGYGFCVNADDFDFTCIRNMDPEHHAVTDGFLLSKDGSLSLTGIEFHWDPNMLDRAELTFADGSVRTITNRARQYTPVWFPMGPGRTAPSITTWSEYCEFDAWGHRATGIVGHWVRRLV